ncbi:MAG: hypothetical protein ABR567_15125 [Myxococcales bacterium]
MLLFALLVGWQAHVHFTHDPPRKSGGSDGEIHVSGSKVRLEEPTPGGTTVVIFDGRKLRLLFPDQKQFVELPKDEAPLATVPPLSLAGMHPAGNEVIDGHPCTIYQRTVETKAGRTYQRLWIPDEKNKKIFFYFLRAVTQTDRGATKADLTDIRQAPQARSLFRVPADYKPKRPR